MKTLLVFIGSSLAVGLSAVLIFHDSWAGGFGWGLGAGLGIAGLYDKAKRKADRNRDVSDVF